MQRVIMHMNMWQRRERLKHIWCYVVQLYIMALKYTAAATHYQIYKHKRQLPKACKQMEFDRKSHIQDSADSKWSHEHPLCFNTLLQ